MMVVAPTVKAALGQALSAMPMVPLTSTGLGGSGGGGGDGGAGGGVGPGGEGVGPGAGGGIASCTTEKVSPAIVARPERSLLVLAAAISVTVPLALPLAPPVTVSHDALLDVVQLQPVSVSTDTVMDPPAYPIRWSRGLIAYRHGAASCFSSTRTLSTDSTAERGDGTTFAATE